MNKDSGRNGPQIEKVNTRIKNKNTKQPGNFK